MGGVGSGRKPAPPPAPCGTSAKYQWHRKRKQDCAICRIAHAAEKRARYKPKTSTRKKSEGKRVVGKEVVAREKLRRGQCMDCALIVTEHNTFVFDFDHRDPLLKSFAISQKRGDVGVDTLMRELEKCDLVCANCHRYRTHSQYRKGVLTGKTLVRNGLPQLFDN